MLRFISKIDGLNNFDLLWILNNCCWNLRFRNPYLKCRSWWVRTEDRRQSTSIYFSSGYGRWCSKHGPWSQVKTQWETKVSAATTLLQWDWSPWVSKWIHNQKQANRPADASHFPQPEVCLPSQRQQQRKQQRTGPGPKNKQSLTQATGVEGLWLCLLSLAVMNCQSRNRTAKANKEPTPKTTAKEIEVQNLSKILKNSNRFGFTELVRHPESSQNPPRCDFPDHLISVQIRYTTFA